jgi:hypothetical protein
MFGAGHHCAKENTMLPILPFPVRFALLVDLTLNATSAVIGPEHVMLGPSPIGQFGILVTAGIVVHEISVTGGRAARSINRWWRRRRHDHE